MIHFTADDAVLEALCFFTHMAFRIGRSRARLDLALCFGDELVCGKRAGLRVPPPLPEVWSGPRSPRRVLVQVPSQLRPEALDSIERDLRGLVGHGLQPGLVVLGDDPRVTERAAGLGLAVSCVMESAPDAYREFLDATDLVLSYETVWGWREAVSHGVPFVPVLSSRVAVEDTGAWAAAGEAMTAYLFTTAEIAEFADLTLGLSPYKAVLLTDACVGTTRQGEDSVGRIAGMVNVLKWLLDGGRPAQARVFSQRPEIAPVA